MKTIPSSQLREIIIPLVKHGGYTYPQLSEKMPSVSDDRWPRLISGETERTHPIPFLESCFFDLMVDEKLPNGSEAKAAFLLNEQIKAAREEGRTAHMAALLDIGSVFYGVVRPSVNGFAAAVLDCLMGAINLLKVQTDLLDGEDKNEPEKTKRRLSKLASKQYQGAIKALHEHNNEDSRSYVNFFLVRAYANDLLAAAELDEQDQKARAELEQKARAELDQIAAAAVDPFAGSRRRAKELFAMGAFHLLLDNARETKRVDVAYDAAELGGLAGVPEAAEEAFLAAFGIVAPADEGTWTGVPYSPLEVPYLRVPFERALKKFLSLSRQENV